MNKLRFLMMLKPEKPAMGQPCNGCGYCCAAEVCAIGIQAFGEVEAPCPAMQFRDGRFWCAVIETAAAADPVFGAHMRWVMAIGRGCDAGTDEESEAFALTHVANDCAGSLLDSGSLVNARRA